MADTRRILLKKLAQRTAVATGVSRRTVSRVCASGAAERTRPAGTPEHYKSRRRIPPEENTRVRAAIYQQYRDKMLPTLDSTLHVLTTCQEGAAGSGAGGCEQSGENFAMDAGGSRAGARAEDGAGPMTGVWASPGASAGVSIGETGVVRGGARGGGQGAYLWLPTTLFRALQDIGFTFSKGLKHDDVARKKASVIRQREDFINTLRQYRASGKVIYYTDETWANKNMSVCRSWNDGNLRSRLDQPSGKGGRIIIAHVGSRETGLL